MNCHDTPERAQLERQQNGSLPGPHGVVRMVRALASAGISYFEFRPGLEGTWSWSGTRFGIEGIQGSDGNTCFLAAVVDEDRESLRALLDAAAPDTLRSAEIRVRTSRGDVSYLQCEVTIGPALAGSPAIVSGVTRNVTHERKFEVELAEVMRRDRLLHTIDACPLSVTIADARKPDFPLIYANRKFEQITGYSGEEVIGRNCRFLQGEGTSVAAIQQIRAALARGEATELRLLNYTKSGKPFLNNLLLSPLFDADGVVNAYMGIQNDITLETLHSDAEAQRQKLEALGRMMGGVAHEMNNMLQPITLLIQHTLDEGLVHEKGREHLEVTADCSRKARQIIGDLLAFSRPATHSSERHKPESLLEDGLRLVQATLPPDIVLAVRIENPLPDLAIERTVFVQILLNLVSNATAAMQGKGHLTVVLKSAVAAGVDPLAGGVPELSFQVIDTGCGMDRLTLDRAFEPFFTTKPVGQGTGLGLPMVYGLVREAGGSMTLASEVGSGTVVTILFPAAPGSSALSPEEG